MKVYIDGKIYDSEEIPIVININLEDKHNIFKMPKGFNLYGSFPDNPPKRMTQKEIQDFMEKVKEEINDYNNTKKFKDG